ncbi:type II secretion system F family protein [Roseiflexus castenholzii]|uniref:type II secretion system F family protein n=1 Tax=Roseiflexus castenholzii TaxID=120962 RepID=UPI003C7C7708
MEYTHAETAWVLSLPLLGVVMAGLLLTAAIMTTRAGAIVALATGLRHRIQQRRVSVSGLIYIPETMPPALATVTVLVGIAVGAVIGVFSSNLVVSVATAIIGALILPSAVSWVAERRYRADIDRQLTPAVGRLATLMRTGIAFPQALGQVVDDMTPGALRQEWQWMTQTFGRPTDAGTPALPSVVCEALAEQTLSANHAAFLLHVGNALTATHPEQVSRIETAYRAMIDQQRRASRMAAELAQMRNTGVVLFLANMIISVYLFLVQRDRFLTAYTSEFGLLAAPIVVGAMLAPLIGGFLFSQADELVY